MSHFGTKILCIKNRGLLLNLTRRQRFFHLCLIISFLRFLITLVMRSSDETGIELVMNGVTIALDEWGYCSPCDASVMLVNNKSRSLQCVVYSFCWLFSLWRKLHMDKRHPNDKMQQ